MKSYCKKKKKKWPNDLIYITTDLPLTMTTESDLSDLNSKPAQVTAVIHRESKVWAPETVEDIRLRSSMKARSKSNAVLLVVNIGTLACTEYSLKYNVHTSQEKNYRESAVSKNSPLQLVCGIDITPRTSC